MKTVEGNYIIACDDINAMREVRDIIRPSYSDINLNKSIQEKLEDNEIFAFRYSNKAYQGWGSVEYYQNRCEWLDKNDFEFVTAGEFLCIINEQKIVLF